MTEELEKKCDHQLKCIHCEQEFPSLDSFAHDLHKRPVLIVNNFTTIICEQAKKKPNFLHKLFHHLLKNY